MSDSLRNRVVFRGDKLFNGAVNIGWFGTDEVRAQSAASAFVFHGPAYHGVSQSDVGSEHGHRLQDTATFAQSVVHRCYGIEDQPFTLAIAGYGTGKSHLGLTLGTLLSAPGSQTAAAVLAGIEGADRAIGADLRAILTEAQQPCLVVALNGMQSFDLTTEVTKQIVGRVREANLDTRPLDELRPRFAQAAGLLRIAATNSDVVDEVLNACGITELNEVLKRLDEQDDSVYGAVHRVLAAKSIKLSALGGESVRDVIDVAVREFCGVGKAFRSLVVLFDEFGRYTEFATIRSHIAGSGVLQDMFEGIQANAGTACFAGFIQFELNAYVQRVAPEHRNEILRYITRYQSANRVYLSINLETLIANLIEKLKPESLDEQFGTAVATQASRQAAEQISRWFPQSRNHRLWSETSQFHNVISKGCWPLSPFSTWFLFHLAAAGKHLQERSALALLGDVFDRFRDHSITEADIWTIAPVDFWSQSLQHELITSEEGGQQGSITHAYASVEARHGAQIADGLRRLLRAVVLASKMSLKVSGRGDAIAALSKLSGVELAQAEQGISLLQHEYNVLEWDEAFKAFDILGDAVPRTQFLAFIRQRVASKYDESGKAALFASKVSAWSDLLGDLDCDFAEEHKITTREWRYQGVTTNLTFLPMQLKIASDRWMSALGVDDARGTIIYCYVEPSRDEDSVKTDVVRLLRSAAKECGVQALPVLVVLLTDEAGNLGQSMAELAVLDESVSAEDRVRFGHLISAHQEKTREVLQVQVEAMIRRRVYITALAEPISAQRLSRVGGELFERIYKKAIPFPFDGFTTAKGNAADSCQELTTDLLAARLDYDAVLSKPIKVKNRAVAVLKDSWGIFAQTGAVRTRPSHPVIRALTENWDELLDSESKRIPLGAAVRNLCAPPHGANLASAGLFLGTFVAPRSEKLSLLRHGQLFSVSQWLQNGVFRGKFLELTALEDVELVRLGAESSEWDTLLDEWEQAESYLAKRASLERADELKRRVPVPPVLGYRELHLREESTAAVRALAKHEEDEDRALGKIESGITRDDAVQLAWGAAELSDLVARMSRDKPLWTDHQIEEIDPHFVRARQAVIQIFPEWLSRQAPVSETPDAVGDFKHRMLRLTGGNLKKLGLDEQFQKLEAHVNHAVRNVETTAEARQLVRDVQSWLTSNGEARRFVRVARLRDQIQVGKEYAAKLQGMSTRTQLPTVSEARNRLSVAIGELKELETGVVKRCQKLWSASISSPDDLEPLAAEVEALASAFEGCPNDLEDLQLMRRALRIYQQNYSQLANERLSWAEFEALAASCASEAKDAVGSEEIPWSPDEVIASFVDVLTSRRNAASAAWISAVDGEAGQINSMPAPEANRLYARASSPPPVLTGADSEKLSRILIGIERRLGELKVEWLVERFRELSPPMRTKFLEIVAVAEAGPHR